MNKKTAHILIAEAEKVLNNAYVPVSDYPVGAAILTDDDMIFQGCNTESVISGLGSCAERNAVSHAVAHGKYRYKALAVASKDKKMIKPCGACLQVLHEMTQISKKDIDIVFIDSAGEIKIESVKTMLKFTIGPEDLGKELSSYRNR